MAKNYTKSWKAKKIIVNFNQYQWRQDLASYIMQKLNWFDVRVSRARTIEKGTDFSNAIKEFEIYGLNIDSCIIKYQNKNVIIETTHPEILSEYLLERTFK